MNTLLYLLGGALLSAPHVGHAQSSGLPTEPHFYGGLGLYSSNNQQLQWRNNDQAQIPVQALVGYQLRPRLAVQLGLAYCGTSSDYAYSLSYSSYYPSPPNTFIDFAGIYKRRIATTTLLARYGLTRTAAHRFQADLLGGPKFEYVYYSDSGSRTTHDQASPVTTTYDNPNHSTQFALSLGIGLRYRLASRLELAYEFTFDQPLYSGYSGGNSLQSTAALGLRYHFGSS
jgi:hypothetical protein